MRSTFRTAVLHAAIAAGVVASTPAWAQPAPDGPRPAAARFQVMREAHEAQRARDLKTVLRLRPDQEPALAAFLQRRGPPERAGLRGQGPAAQALTTPQRLDEMARRDAEHAQVRRERTEKIRGFYAALDPQQRQVFDALQRMQHASRGRGGPARGGWGHRGFEGPPPRG